MSESPWCHGHHPDRAQERVRIASAGGRGRSRPGNLPDNSWSGIGEAELAARNTALARDNEIAAAMDTLINTRQRRLKDDKPPPDRQRALDATRDAKTRLAWAQWHRDQAERHRKTLDDLIAHHEGEAERLSGRLAEGGG